MNPQNSAAPALQIASGSRSIQKESPNAAVQTAAPCQFRLPMPRAAHPSFAAHSASSAAMQNMPISSATESTGSNRSMTERMLSDFVSM